MKSIPAVRLHPESKLVHMEPERAGRGFVYSCSDKFGRVYLVSQHLGRIAKYLSETGLDDARVSSLYDCLSRTDPYKHRWTIKRMKLEDCVHDIEAERSARSYENQLVLGHKYLIKCVDTC